MGPSKASTMRGYRQSTDVRDLDALTTSKKGVRVQRTGTTELLPAMNAGIRGPPSALTLSVASSCFIILSKPLQMSVKSNQAIICGVPGIVCTPNTLASTRASAIIVVVHQNLIGYRNCRGKGYTNHESKTGAHVLRLSLSAEGKVNTSVLVGVRYGDTGCTTGFLRLPVVDDDDTTDAVDDEGKDAVAVGWRLRS